jgi:deoxycytidine triphosphate deaminase
MPDKHKESDLFAEASTRPGILTDEQIRTEVSQRHLISGDTFQPTSLEASSYDIRVGDKGILGGEGVEADLRKGPMELSPGAYAGIISHEKLCLPASICGRIGSKRALAYEGIILLTGTVVDPGYEGHLLFGLYNASQKRVLIRAGRKICNIVFERLPEPVEKTAPTDPNLLTGNFPDAFVDKMANMEVLPWMQISDRVKQIEQITKDILDLKARYEDVLQPIRDLTASVGALTSDVTSLTAQTKNIADDVTKVNNIVGENSKQISQLTANLAVIGGNVQTVQERARGLEDGQRDQAEKLASLRTSVGRFQVLIYIFWAIVLLVAGALLQPIVKSLLGL